MFLDLVCAAHIVMSVGSAPGAFRVHLTKGNGFSISQSIHPPIAFQLGVGLVGPFPLHANMLSSLTVRRSCEGRHNCFELVTAAISPCPEDTSSVALPFP